MTANKLEKIKRQIAACQRKANTHRDLSAIAISLKRVQFNRGKEPTYISSIFQDLRPISIPNHSGRNVSPGVSRSILDQLEEDVFRFEEELKKEKEKNKEGNNSYENGEDNER